MRKVGTDTAASELEVLAEELTPNGRKNVVQLDVDGTEGQEARHQHLRQSLPVPR